MEQDLQLLLHLDVQVLFRLHYAFHQLVGEVQEETLDPLFVVKMAVQVEEVHHNNHLLEEQEIHPQLQWLKVWMVAMV